MIDRAAILDRAGAVGAAAAVIVALAVAPAAAAAATPCVAAGMLAILPPAAAVPRAVGPAVTAADRESTVADAYAEATGGTGLTIAHVTIGAAGCVDPAGTPGGTSTRATAWNVLGGAVGGSALQVDLVPKSAPGAGWHMRPNLDGLLVERKPATLADDEMIPLGDWGVLDRPDVVDAGAGAPLRWWKAALEVRVIRLHAGLPAGTRMLIGWVAADREPAAPPPAVVTTPTTPTTTTTPEATTPTTTTTATTTTPKKQAPRRHATAKPTKKKKTTTRHHPKKKQRPVPRKGQPLTVTPPVGAGNTYDFPVFGTASWGDTYGAGRSDVPGGWHHGDDLFVSLGTPVVAVADGIVFAVGWNKVGGWRLWLQDASGNDFYYAHLSGYTKLARNNHHVRRGQVLGFVGNTGDAFTTIPHLHFEVHPFGLLSLGYDGAVDPTQYLAGWRRPGSVTDVLPPVPLPSPNFRGAGSLTDYRRLLALRPLAKPREATPPGIGQDVLKMPKKEALAGAAVTSNASGGWAPAAAGILLLVLAAFAVWLTARAGRADQL
jgi:murein DD-endopeptidase MepM/ murein hydrolase activator NlpD